MENLRTLKRKYYYHVITFQLWLTFDKYISLPIAISCLLEGSFNFNVNSCCPTVAPLKVRFLTGTLCFFNNKQDPEGSQKHSSLKSLNFKTSN